MGPWWPAPSAALRAAAQHWATWAMQKQELARNLISQHDLLLRNQGRTAEDLIGRYLRGAKSEVTKAEKYEIKKGAFNTAADAIDYLRSRLTGIAGEGNKEIDDVLASKKPLPEQLAEIQAIQTRCNADAANASRDAVDKVMTAMQEILEAEDIGDDPRTWARAALGVIGPIGGWGAGFSGGARSLESCGWTGWCELVDNGRRLGTVGHRRRDGGRGIGSGG